MAVGGLFDRCPNHAQAVVEFALEVLESIQQMAADLGAFARCKWAFSLVQPAPILPSSSAVSPQKKIHTQKAATSACVPGSAPERPLLASLAKSSSRTTSGDPPLKQLQRLFSFSPCLLFRSFFHSSCMVEILTVFLSLSFFLFHPFMGVDQMLF